MATIIECVPNFSEGRNRRIIQAIAQSVRDTDGATLLDVDAGADFNRTVYTFVGDPDAVVEAAFNAVRSGIVDTTHVCADAPAASCGERRSPNAG